MYTVQPVIRAISRVPDAIRDKLKETLNSYESRCIIKKVEGPTAYCNSLVIIESQINH